MKVWRWIKGFLVWAFIGLSALLVGAIGAVVVLAPFALYGVIIWAIVMLVLHFCK